MNPEQTPSLAPWRSGWSSSAMSGLLRKAVGVAAGGSILLYAILVLLRIGYPFELETFEGLTADHVSRILQGKSIYVAPSVDFVSNIYPPLFYYLSAGLAWVFGVNLWVLRLVSVFASVGCLGILYGYVRRETGSRFCGFLSAGFYAATYGICVGWFDVARVDSLYLFFLLAGVYGLRFQKTPGGGLLAGALLVLAAFTKQTAFSAVLPALCAVTLARPRRAVWCLVPFLLLLGGGSFLLDRLHEGGWYRTYVLEHLAQHALRPGQGADFWVRHVFRQMPLISIAALLGLWRGFSGQTNWRDRLFLPALALGLLATAWIGRWSVGGAENALLPSCALFALLMGVLLQKGLEQTTSPRKQTFLYALVLIQFGLVVYDPRPLVPSRADREAGEALIERLKGIEGDVWVAFHGHLGPMAGKPIRAIYYQPLISMSSLGEPKPASFPGSLDRAVREQRFAAILFDAHSLPEGWDAYYQDAGPVFERRDVFWPVTGYKTRPKAIFVPRPRNETEPSLPQPAAQTESGGQA